MHSLSATIKAGPCCHAQFAQQLSYVQIRLLGEPLQGTSHRLRVFIEV